MHFSRQAQCQNNEKWSFFSSLFVKSEVRVSILGSILSKINIFISISFWFWVSFRSKMQWKWCQEWSQKWMKNGWKRPTVNNPIVELDLKDLKDPSILAKFLNFVPEYLLLRITCENWAEKEDCENRKLDKLNSSPSEPFLDAKWCRMDGSKVAERVIGSQHVIDFCWNVLHIPLVQDTIFTTLFIVITWRTQILYIPSFILLCTSVVTFSSTLRYVISYALVPCVTNMYLGWFDSI